MKSLKEKTNHFDSHYECSFSNHFHSQSIKEIMKNDKEIKKRTSIISHLNIIHSQTTKSFSKPFQIKFIYIPILHRII